MNLETILSELREKRRTLDAAITALESLQKQHRQEGTPSPTRRKRSSAAPVKKRVVADTQTKAAVGASSGELIRFPAVGRRVRVGRGSSDQAR